MAGMKVYLDNGATTMADPAVVSAMLPFFSDNYGNASSLHRWGRDAKKALLSARQTVAGAINAEPGELIFTSGGTESDNLAIKGAAYAAFSKGKKDHLITTRIEHPAVLRTFEALEKQGFFVTYLDVDKEGFVSMAELEKAITDRTILVSVMHANNEIGTIQDIGKIGEICRKAKVLFHTDAVQSFTKMEIDVIAQKIDLASFSAHKIHGPKGIGALFVRKGVRLESQALGGGHEFRHRAGTENITGIVGFAKAVEIAMKDFDLHRKQIAGLRDRLISGLLEISDSRLNGPAIKPGKDSRLCNNVNVGFDYVEGEAILLHLDMAGIAVSTGSACSSQSLEPSHVLLAIGLLRKESHGTIRYTLSRYTTKEEIDYTISKTKEIIAKLREYSPLNKDTIDQYEDVDEHKCEH